MSCPCGTNKFFSLKTGSMQTIGWASIHAEAPYRALFEKLGAKYRFRLTGSVTGEDGTGESGKRFISKSGRIVIEAEDLQLSGALEFSRNREALDATIQWKVVPYFADEFALPKRNPFGDTVVTAAQGLLNGKHVLEIAGGGTGTPLAAIKVYRPSR